MIKRKPIFASEKLEKIYDFKASKNWEKRGYWELLHN